MAKAKLEKVLEYLINKDEDAARELLHQVIVEKAKQIHESLMEEEGHFEHGDHEEDGVEEDSDSDMELEEYFTDDDLSEADDDLPDDADGEDLATDMSVDFDDVGADTDAAADTDVPDMDADSDDVGDMDLEDALQELQREFAALKDEVEDLKGEDGDEFSGDDADDDVETGDLDTPVDPSEMGADDEEEMPVGESEDDADFFEELDGLLGEDFDDLSEAIVDELEPVKFDPTKSRYVGSDNSQWKSERRDSNVNPKSFGQRSSTKPYEIKSSTHTGYDRETAPKVQVPVKPAKNSLKKADERQGDALKAVNQKALLAGGRHPNDPAGYNTKPESMEGGSLLARAKKDAKVNVKENRSPKINAKPAPKAKKSR